MYYRHNTFTQIKTLTFVLGLLTLIAGNYDSLCTRFSMKVSISQRRFTQTVTWSEPACITNQRHVQMYLQYEAENDLYSFVRDRPLAIDDIPCTR